MPGKFLSTLKTWGKKENAIHLLHRGKIIPVHSTTSLCFKVLQEYRTQTFSGLCSYVSYSARLNADQCSLLIFSADNIEHFPFIAYVGISDT